MTKLLTLGILSSTAVTAVVVAKLVMLGILPLTSFISALRASIVAKLLILGISPLTSFILALRVVLVAKLVISGILSEHYAYISFLTTLFFTTSLSLLRSSRTGTNLSTSNLSTLLFKLVKLVGTFFNLLISNLSISGFELAKSDFF